MLNLAAFPQFVDFTGNPMGEAFTLVIIHSVIVVAWFSFLVIALSSVAQVARSEKFKRSVQGATAVLLLWFGYRLITYDSQA